MENLLLCNDCEKHLFIVITGAWTPGAIDGLVAPIILFCAGCGTRAPMGDILWTDRAVKTNPEEMGEKEVIPHDQS